MRRKLFVLTVVAALMAAMMLTAGPAQANVSLGGGSISNGLNLVQNGGNISGFGHNGIDFDDDNGIELDGIDLDGINNIGNNGFFGFGGGIEQDSRSGELETDFSVV